MASHEPSEGEISQVIDFAGLDPQEDRPMAIQALKVSEVATMLTAVFLAEAGHARNCC